MCASSLPDLRGKVDRRRTQVRPKAHARYISWLHISLDFWFCHYFLLGNLFRAQFDPKLQRGERCRT